VYRILLTHSKGVPNLHHHLAHLLSTYGYWGLCGGLALEYLFIPVPGETMLTTIGILWQNPKYHLHLFWLLLSTTAGTFSGAMFAYLVGRALGRPFLIRFGKYIRLTPERIDKVGKLFTKYTVPTLIFSRYIAGIRIIVPYIAGINRVRLLVFAPVMLISSLMWTATFILAGSVIEKAWARFIENWQRNIIPALIVLLILVVLYIYIHRWMKRKLEVEDSGDHADEDPTSPSDSNHRP
jgi:membrane protein DedA with SNARE-associated domain